MMKLFKILLGTLFGAWALSILVAMIKNHWVEMNMSTRGVTEIAAHVAALGTLTLVSVWSFQSAFRKRVRRR
jgi:hypothetical protein